MSWRIKWFRELDNIERRVRERRRKWGRWIGFRWRNLEFDIGDNFVWEL